MIRILADNRWFTIELQRCGNYASFGATVEVDYLTRPMITLQLSFIGHLTVTLYV